MSRILIVGATGTLGRHLSQQALATNNDVTVLVRTPSKLPDPIRKKVTVRQADVTSTSVSALAGMLRGHDAVINAAGHVAEGQSFVDLVERLVTALEFLPERDRPVCWFSAGAALLDIDDRGRRGVDLPGIASTYWPHRANFNRLGTTALDWRILCPGPMVDQSPTGLYRMRISLDRVPVHIPPSARFLPGALVVPFLLQRIPEMIVSYADAAAMMLANLSPFGPMSRHRVGLALPVGMRGRKKQWAARRSAA